MVPSPAKSVSRSSQETSRMIHELQMHQIQLEIQDEELRRVQSDLAASQARYFDLYNQAPVGYCTVTEQGVFLEVNETACILLKIDRSVLNGQSIARLIHQEDQNIFDLHRKQLIETGCFQSFELRMVKSDTTIFWVEVLALAAREADGISVHRIVLRDISDKKLIEETLLYRVAIEKLIAKISSRFVGIQKVDEIEIQIKEALQEVAEFANATRIRMVLLSEDEKRYLKVYEWLPETSLTVQEILEGTAVFRTPWLFDRLKTGDVIVISCVDALPKQARVERKIWKRLSVGAFVAIPLVRGKTLLGYLGFDRVHPCQIWKEEHVHLLRLLGELFINVLQLQEVKKKKKLLREQLAKQYSLDNVIGKHGKMEEVFRLVHKVAPENTTVIIYGETGVGKEQIARAIHQLSPRSAAPLYAINCAAIPEHLLESELFGHERGAFTGAYARKKGILEEASGSSLFLDEIGDLRQPLQAKILRMLQEREIRRVGGSTLISIDVRIISATNQDLGKMMAKGNFRADLYYRLNTYPIIIPPLRERATDIPLLVNHFLQKYKNRNQPRPKKLSIQALEAILSYAWPGNVRELESVIERAVILADGEIIDQKDLPQEVLFRTVISQPAWNALDLPHNGFSLTELEKYLLARALEKSDGVIARAARLLGLTYRTFQYRMIKYGLTDYTKQ